MTRSTHQPHRRSSSSPPPRRESPPRERLGEDPRDERELAPRLLLREGARLDFDERLGVDAREGDEDRVLPDRPDALPRLLDAALDERRAGAESRLREGLAEERPRLTLPLDDRVRERADSPLPRKPRVADEPRSLRSTLEERERWGAARERDDPVERVAERPESLERALAPLLREDERPLERSDSVTERERLDDRALSSLERRASLEPRERLAARADESRLEPLRLAERTAELRSLDSRLLSRAAARAWLRPAAARSSERDELRDSPERVAARLRLLARELKSDRERCSAAHWRRSERTAVLREPLDCTRAESGRRPSTKRVRSTRPR